MIHFLKRFLAYPAPLRSGDDARALRRRVLIAVPVMLWIAGVGAAVPSGKPLLAVALQYPPFLIVVGLLAPLAYARANEAEIKDLFEGAAILLVPMIAADLILRLFPTVWGPWTYFLLWPAILPAPIMFALSLLIVVWLAPAHRPPQYQILREIRKCWNMNSAFWYTLFYVQSFIFYALMTITCSLWIMRVPIGLIMNAIGLKDVVSGAARAAAFLQPPEEVSGVASLLFSGLMIVSMLIARRIDRRRQAAHGAQMREASD